MPHNATYSVDTVLGVVALDDPLFVPASATLREVAAQMSDGHVSCVLVGSGPYGLASDHDLAGALAAGMGADACISQVATRPLVWATTSTTVLDAAAMMVNHSIRHLVVIEVDGRPRGVLSLASATAMLLDADVPLSSWPWQ